MKLEGARVVVTGGSGFLGRHVVAELEGRGAGEVVVPRSANYDLVDRAACRRLVTDAKPDLMLHLAHRVNRLALAVKNH